MGEGTNLGNLGSAYFQLENARRAINTYEQHLAITHETGDWMGEGMARGDLIRTILQYLEEVEG